jgi:hypothetical protein
MGIPLMVFIVAGFFRFKPHACFELDGPEDRQAPKVSFGG